MAGDISRQNGKKRKKASHTIEASAAKARIIQRVGERIDELVDLLFEKAVTKDVSAIKELLDRAYGRPMQAVEMSGKDGKDLFTPSDKIKELAQHLNEIHRQGTGTSG